MMHTDIRAATTRFCSAWPLYLALLVMLATVTTHLSLLQLPSRDCSDRYSRSSFSFSDHSDEGSRNIHDPAAVSLPLDVNRRAPGLHRSSSSRGGHDHGQSSHRHPRYNLDSSNSSESSSSSLTQAAAAHHRAGGGTHSSVPAATSPAAAAQPGSAASAAAEVAAATRMAAAAAGARPQSEQQQAQSRVPPIFVGVLSHSQNFAARQAIRSTWGSDSRLARVVFFVLRPATKQGVHALRSEAADFGDIVVTSSVEESYYNCTHSVLAMMQAAAAMGPAVDFLVKADDDCYVRASKLLNALKGMPRQLLYAGFSMQAIPTPRDGRWAIPFKAWPHPMTAPYSYGLAYVLSMDLVQNIAAGGLHAAMDAENVVPIEDIAVGIAVEAIGFWQGADIIYDTSMPYSIQGCDDVSVFVQMPKKIQDGAVYSEIMFCMHKKQGSCCFHNGGGSGGMGKAPLPVAVQQ